MRHLDGRRRTAVRDASPLATTEIFSARRERHAHCSPVPLRVQRRLRRGGRFLPFDGARSRRMSLGGGLYVEDMGAGAPAVLLHSCGIEWTRVAAPRGRTARTATPDNRSKYLRSGAIPSVARAAPVFVPHRRRANRRPSRSGRSAGAPRRAFVRCRNSAAHRARRAVVHSLPHPLRAAHGGAAGIGRRTGTPAADLLALLAPRERDRGR